MKYTELFNYWKRFTNIKASLDHVGKYIYKDWTGFTVDDIRKQVGLYAIYGIVPSTRMEMLFKIHNKDQVNGSKLLKNIFGP